MINLNFTTSEAMPAERPALPKLLKLYELQGAKMNLCDRDTPEAYAREIEEEYHRLIGAIADRKTVCKNTKDALAALQFIKREFDGESCMGDRLVRAVIEWVKSVALEDATRQANFQKEMEKGFLRGSRATVEAHG